MNFKSTHLAISAEDRVHGLANLTSIVAIATGLQVEYHLRPLADLLLLSSSQYELNVTRPSTDVCCLCRHPQQRLRPENYIK